ncbi:MAG: S1 RNA-binding domain-containing protein [Oscillospiraceae bacterium]|jgi:S1 RNA binding domain protein|nr:S1 RNA-binding domain-containing protein [Oscillospiraceae bacterium]
MELEIGSVVTGKVTGITKFGAFVEVAQDRKGLVHISEIAGTYVSEVSDYLTVGQEVTVKVIGMESGKLNLSIKAALPQSQEREARSPRGSDDTRSRRDFGESRRERQPRDDADSARERADDERKPASFEDRLQKFMKDTDNKFSGLLQFSNRKGSRRRGK